MDHWIDAAFSTGGFVGHLSYVLLVISMMMRDISLLRILVIASALTGIAYDLIWLRNPVGVFWEGLLLLVNVVQLYLLWHRDRRAQFSSDEEAFLAHRLHGLSPGRCRDLLDMGRWERLAAGTVLTRQGERPEFLTYLAHGNAAIRVDDQEISTVSAGHYVGEMSLVGSERASATVVLSEPAQVWRLELDKVDRLRKDQPEIANALLAGIAVDMRKKIVTGNMAAMVTRRR